METVQKMKPEKSAEPCVLKHSRQQTVGFRGIKTWRQFWCTRVSNWDLITFVNPVHRKGFLLQTAFPRLLCSGPHWAHLHDEGLFSPSRAKTEKRKTN